jgi:hypothetical protein
MQKIDWFDYCEKLFDAEGKKTLHVNRMSELADELGVIPFGETTESLAKRLSQYLSANVRSKNPSFSKVSNKKGGYLKGVYRLKPQKTLPLTPVVKTDVSTSYTGKAGEFAVLSELLFRGFNASIMTVDEGIDVVASKANRYFHIQVKTANWTEGRPYSASIKTKAFQHGGDVYYFVVMRQPTQIRFVNEFAIFSSQDIRRWVAKGVLKEATSINLRISIERGKYYLNGSEDITSHVNDFDMIC